MQGFLSMTLHPLLRLALLFFAALAVSAFAADQPAPTPPDTTHPIATVLQPFVNDRVLPGAVTLVADKDKVLNLEAVGYADVAAKKPMATNDLFWIASMSKPITATAMMMLVEEGKVGLDDPVSKYIPEFKAQMIADKKHKDVPPHAPTHPLTIRLLLSLSGGLPFGPTWRRRMSFSTRVRWPNGC